MSERDLPIPTAALAQHIIALGKTRSGKSSKLRVIVEHLLEESKPVCIIDPKGDWWGLKSSANGKTSGYPIVIFGGEHADVPLNPHAGAHVAELVATGNRSCLIDLGGWTVGDRTRFFIDFASALFKLTRGQRYLAIDECHNFATKGKIFDVEAGKCLHWANRLASEGQGKGLVLLAASQRPQKVHNDFLTSCETLIACRVIHKADRDAIKDWIDGCADASTGREVLASLAQMQRADAWVWSPEVEFGPKQITFPMFRTYDSFKPQPADLGKLKGWADVDLEDVKAKLAGVVKQAEANDPRKLKARIAELERQAANIQPPAPIVTVDTAEIERLKAEIAELWNNVRIRNDELNKRAEFIRECRDALVPLQNLIARLELSDYPNAGDPNIDKLVAMRHPKLPKPSAPAPAARTPDRIALPSRPAAASAPRPRANGHAAGDSSLGKGERAVLTAIAQSGEADPEQLTVLTGYKRSSRDTYLQRLRANGFVSDGWPAVATAAGIAALGDFEPLPTGAALRAHWLAELGNGGERQILEVLVEAYPHGLSREQISDATVYKRSSRDTYLQKLGARKLIEYRGSEVFASERLF